MAGWQLIRFQFIFPLILLVLFLMDGNLAASLGFLMKEPIHAMPMMTFTWLFYAIQFGVEKKLPYYTYVVLFGILFDVFYTGILGTYTLAFLVGTFAMEKLRPYFDERMMSGLLLLLIGLMIYLFVTYVAGQLIGAANLSLLAFIVYLFMPTALFNLVVAAIFYYPAWGLFQRLG
ncbi:rod shape-determining protein MreD [Fructobacillus sp. M1-13]|uniref:Rod shape-determining protein MreD n=1 Tax=Fructobacillus papyriferae TaxID=2713171 RepID=A0ABS5QNT4_9LACO|nr:rod shape-determining protein MreD [Fructobacillus papyriferae]MBS9334427.1 rod shape-determining protein MreD [Fructobacillus papyriferae]MCD2158416.1 rod shape-determining protein MreD [Fructobacillus papyriferae]